MTLLLNYLRKQRSESILLAALLSFLFCHYFIGSNAAYRLSIWLLVLPIGFYILFKDKSANLKFLLQKPFIWPIIAFFSYAFLHSLYFNLFYNIAASALAHCFFNLGFVLSVIILFARLTDRQLNYFDSAVILLALTSGILTLVLYTFYNYKYYPTTRWIGIAQNDHSILGALVFCQSGILALGVYLKDKANRIQSNQLRTIVLLSTFAVCLITVFLSQSKGVILSLALSILILFFLFGYRKLALLGFIAFSLGFTFLFFVFVEPIPSLVKIFFYLPSGHEIYDRGDSYRMEVWNKAIEFIQNKPIFGHGLKAPFLYRFAHPHNLFLGILYHFGLVGLGFFLYLLSTIFSYQPLKNMTPEQKIYFTLFCVALLGGLTDLARPISGVSILWVIIWLPFAIFLGLRSRRPLKESQSF